jgi:antitoxin component of MazEF toxin-antitoxin module
MQLIDIGNSRGIRLPKTIINKYGFSKGVRVVEEKKSIKIFP